MDQQLAGLQREQFSTLFETECDYMRPRRGQIRQAVVLSVDENDVIVDLGCKIDREHERIGLSRKRLLPDPWINVTDRLQVGHAVDGVVSEMADFGIFVDLGEGVEGLVHVSEMPDKEAVYTELEPGDSIRVRVLEINRWRRRIALSLQGVERMMPSSVVKDTVPLLADKNRVVSEVAKCQSSFRRSYVSGADAVSH